MCESVERDGEWFGGAVEVSGLGSSARRGVVTERCFANAWKCVEQDDSVYPSIRSSRGGGAKRGRAWLKTVNVTLALGSDRYDGGDDGGIASLCRCDTFARFHVNRQSFLLLKPRMK